MDRLSKSYVGKEILIYGCTKSDSSYYKKLYKRLTEDKIKVYALPTNPESDLGFETYKDLDSLPRIPECAFVLSSKKDSLAAVEALHKHRIKRILFYSKKYASKEAVNACRKYGIEVCNGCPLMLYESGICWLHAASCGELNERERRI